jgi:hypothetical protein
MHIMEERAKDATHRAECCSKYNNKIIPQNQQLHDSSSFFGTMQCLLGLFPSGPERL